jgi:DNA modification methylase
MSQNERQKLYNKFLSKIEVNQDLNRRLVSFQGNKTEPFHRWFRYKEAYSSDLIRYLLSSIEAKGKLLDPFSGTGTSLFTADRMGLSAVGIDIFPVANFITKAKISGQICDARQFSYFMKRYETFSSNEKGREFSHLRITEGAFSAETEADVSNYTAFIDKIDDANIKHLFQLAALAVLEDVSYTRKDGQCLRWDVRSGKSKSMFKKNSIKEFKPSVTEKLCQMFEDIRRYNAETSEQVTPNIEILEGTCFEKMIGLEDSSFDVVCFSPSYCNRYDYTRTYALELAFLGYGEEEVKRFRQQLLSATVENKSKREYLKSIYQQVNRLSDFYDADARFRQQTSIREVLSILYDAKQKKLLNNNNIPSLVDNYLFEMNIVIREIARVLKVGGTAFIVNDNVRYHGEEVPLDIIFSDLAEKYGLTTKKIWVLPRGKGNSSQQMGRAGRVELRKCIYEWKKP